MTSPPAPAPSAPPAPGGDPVQPPPSPPVKAPPRRSRVPHRVLALAGAAVIAVALLFTAATTAIGNAREGLTVIGHDAGPQVVATADLYFALSDMDAQVANVLLMGRETTLGRGRQDALQRYEQRRAEASRALLQAAELATGDETEERTVRAVLDGLGRYERLASQAILLDEQAQHAAGPPPAQVIELYRRATDLMRLDLLPKAYNLTLESGTIVRRTYEEESNAVQTGRLLVGAAGTATVVLLILLQIYLARRFRRVVNPALVLATFGVALLTLSGMALLERQAEDLRVAKEDGFNSVLALSRARAIGNTMHGDQSRYLLDPQRADVYEQVYLEKSQSVLYTPSGNLQEYYTGVDRVVSAYPGKADFLGFHGTEASSITLAGQREAIKKVLDGYREFQQRDRQMRLRVKSDQDRQAIVARMGPVARSFEAYDEALVDLIALHHKAFEQAIRDGDEALGGWNIILPGVLLAVTLLIGVGVGPRLSEYR
mgnify:CR=1 FL=1